MEILLSGYQKWFFGIFLILHGFIYLTIINFTSEDGKEIGWNGRSWLLSNRLHNDLVMILGKLSWILVLVLHTAAGLAIVGVTLWNDYTSNFIMIASITALISYIIFVNGLRPTWYNWLIGVAIELTLLIYTTGLVDQISTIIATLHVLVGIGFLFVFVTEVVPEFRSQIAQQATKNE